MKLLNHSEQILIDSITSILSMDSNKFNHRQVYHHHNTAHLSHSDESQIVAISFSQWNDGERTQEEESKFYDLDDSIARQVLSLAPKDGEHQKWTLTTETGFMRQWDSNYGDFIRIQFSDHSFYITILYSGQY